MAEIARQRPISHEEKLRLLTGTYRSILERYREIERLSREERRLLIENEPVPEVIEILRRKREQLRAIRAEEESVSGAREWWKRTRRSLPSGVGRELLSLLDAISRKLERTLALETECRTLLDRALAWGTSPAEPSHQAASGVAAAAYGRESSPTREDL